MTVEESLRMIVKLIIYDRSQSVLILNFSTVNSNQSVDVVMQIIFRQSFKLCSLERVT